MPLLKITFSSSLSPLLGHCLYHYGIYFYHLERGQIRRHRLLSSFCIAAASVFWINHDGNMWRGRIYISIDLHLYPVHRGRRSTCKHHLSGLPLSLWNQLRWLIETMSPKQKKATDWWIPRYVFFILFTTHRVDGSNSGGGGRGFL